MKKTASSRSAPAAAPQNIEQSMSLAWQAYGAAKPRDAETICARIVKQYPEHAHAWYLRGLATAALGKPQLALKHFDKVTNSPDLLPALAQARGRALMALDRIEEALDRFQEALAYKPDDASTYYFLGLAKIAQGATEDARRFLRQCTLLEPGFGPAHYELGVFAMQAGQPIQAVTSFRAASEFLPDSPEVANNLGLACQAAGDADAAETSYRQALALNGAYAEAWFNLGILLRSMGREDAEAALQRATQLDPALAKMLADHG